MSNNLTLEEVHQKLDEESPRRRRYDICTALDMTKIGIQFERLERLGVSRIHTQRWHDRAMHLLNDILDVSDPLLSAPKPFVQEHAECLDCDALSQLHWDGHAHCDCGEYWPCPDMESDNG